MGIQEKIIPTGNEFISLPMIRETDGSILSLNTLHMLHKGLISFYGTQDVPFLTPYVKVNGKQEHLTDIKWSFLSNWIPVFTACVENYAGLAVEGTILTPPGEKAFIYHFSDFSHIYYF